MSKVMLKNLEDYIWAAINHNYMLGILVTSQAEGKLESEGWGYGVGKSTIALSFLKYFVYKGAFDKAMKHLISFPEHLNPFLQPPRTPGVMWDDMQLTVSKAQAWNPKVRELAYFLTTQRTHIAVLIGTCPHRGLLQKDFREQIFDFEIIVPKRGSFEIQQLKRRLDFHNPVRIKERLHYKGEGPFLALTEDEQQIYDEWREWRDSEAKKRIKLLNPKDSDETEKDIKRLTSDKFYDLARSTGLKGRRSAFHELWRETVYDEQ